jgi:Resolvase, N terminal domain
VSPGSSPRRSPPARPARPELDKAVGLEFLTGELQGSHDLSGIVFTVLAALSGMERESIRDRTLEGHESARTRGKTIGGAAVTDDAMLSMALHLRDQQLSLRDIASRLVITKGKKNGQHPSPATVLRMLREHDEKTAAARRTADQAVSRPGQKDGPLPSHSKIIPMWVLGLLGLDPRYLHPSPEAIAEVAGWLAPREEPTLTPSARTVAHGTTVPSCRVRPGE